MVFISLGLLTAILGTLGIGLGDFFAGISARKINERKTLLFIFSSQALCSFLYWLVFKHTFESSLTFITLIAIAGIFQGIGLMLFYKAMTMEKISLISPIFATYSALTILFGVFILKDHLSLLKLISICIVFLGAFLASSDFSVKKLSFSKGVGISFIGTLSFAVAFLLMTIVFKFSEFYFANFLYSLSTFLVALLINRKELHQIKKVRYISLPIFVGIIYASSNIVWAISLSQIPSSVFGAVGATFPAVTALAGFILLKERLVKIQIIGVSAILIGLILLGISS